MSARHARDCRGCAVTRRYLNKQHLAADVPDKIGADHLVENVVGALDQQLWPDRLNKLQRGIFFEDNDQIDGGQRRQYFGAGPFRLDRASRSLQPRRRAVAVETDDEPIAGCLGLPEQPDMAGMQQVETAVGEADLEPLAAPALDQIE